MPQENKMIIIINPADNRVIDTLETMGMKVSEGFYEDCDLHYPPHKILKIRGYVDGIEVRLVVNATDHRFEGYVGSNPTYGDYTWSSDLGEVIHWLKWRLAKEKNKK